MQLQQVMIALICLIFLFVTHRIFLFSTSTVLISDELQQFNWMFFLLRSKFSGVVCFFCQNIAENSVLYKELENTVMDHLVLYKVLHFLKIEMKTKDKNLIRIHKKVL